MRLARYALVLVVGAALGAGALLGVQHFTAAPSACARLAIAGGLTLKQCAKADDDLTTFALLVEACYLDLPTAGIPDGRTYKYDFEQREDNESAQRCAASIWRDALHSTPPSR